MKIIPQRPTVLNKQYRWKKSPILFWGALQSFPMVLLLSVLITLGCLFYLWQWMNFRQTAFQVQTLEKEKKQVSLQLELLQVEVDFLMRPQRLESLAFKDLRLYYPTLPYAPEPILGFSKNAGVP